MIWLLLGVCFLTNCKKPSGDPSPEEKAKKIWVADRVSENSTVVYERNGSTQIRNYSAFRLDLSSPPSAILTEVDGTILRGQYEIRGRNQLLLSGLTPIPTGTDGSISYTMTFVDEVLELVQTTSNLKTGHTKNTYRLVNP